MMKRLILLLAVVLLPGVMSAQTKQETRLFDKTISKATLAAYDKFLSKYPQSVYAELIAAKRDTILSITPYSSAEALDILAGIDPQGDFSSGKVTALAFPSRADAVDRIVAVGITPDTLSFTGVRVYSLTLGKNGWNLDDCTDYPAGCSPSEFAPCGFDGNGSLEDGTVYFKVSYESAGSGRLGCSAIAFIVNEFSMQSLSFSGKNLGDGRIEGISDEAMLVGMERPVMQRLKKEIDSDPRLVRISEADYLTDEAVSWWLANNPDALTTASRIKFGSVPAESSLVQKYLSAKGKQNCSKYRAAMFDIRGYTVIVAYHKASSSYVLAWAEPECRDHYRDRLLNDIYFESGSSLAMFYYHGRRTFKLHLNLAEKTIKR